MTAGMPMAGHAMLHGTYDVRVVALSVVIASVAAYVALSLGERVTQNRGAARHLWLLGGASAMGTGIWSMHFTGMLAFRLPVPVGYDINTVLLSLLAAVVASGVALGIVSRPSMGARAWLAGGVLMGTAIAVMHYTGMAAMRVPAVAQWDARIVAASVAIAVVVSLAALALVFQLRAVSGRRFDWRRGAAALVMGVAVAGMHYTGMAAATFLAAPAPEPAAGVVTPDALGNGSIVVVTLLVLAAALVMAYVDRWFFAHELALAETKSHFGAVVSSAPVMLFALDAAGRITMARGRDLARVGCDAEDAVGSSFFETFADVHGWIEQAHRALGGEEFASICDVRGIVIEMRWTPVRGDDESVAGLIAVGTDITERRRAEEALKHQALHDVLTGLPNRAALNERLALAHEAAKRNGTTLGLAVLDLNRFKEINDTLGHGVGDTLLQCAGARVRGALRQEDFVARLGGDEFAIVLPGATEANAEQLVQRIVAAFDVPVTVEEHTLDINAAVGLALYPVHAGDAATLLRCADVAMYVAKRAGVGAALYDAYTDSHSHARLMMENGLRKAITDNELLLHYQPTVDLATETVVQVEALVRWAHPTLGVLPPGAFIDIAEDTGVILPLTRWVLDHALQQVQRWERSGTNLCIAVNLSMRALHDPTLPDTVERLLRQYGVSPNKLTLEVTESALMADIERTRAILTQLSELGVTISVDDFGTGYAGLGYLTQLPVDEIKIDRSFVSGMDQDGKDAAIVRWVNGLGHVLGLRVVAEGVETTEALESLTTLGCDVAQGYYISRPLPADELGAWMAHTSWAKAAPAAGREDAYVA